MVSYNLYFKQITALLLFAFLFLGINAQEPINPYYARKHNIYVNARPIFYLPAKVTFDKPINPLNGRVEHDFALNYDVGIHYRYNINHLFSVGIGIRGESRAMNVKVFLNNDFIQKYVPSNEYWGEDRLMSPRSNRTNINFSVAFPITLDYRFYAIKNHSFLAKLSTTIKLTPNSDFSLDAHVWDVEQDIDFLYYYEYAETNPKAKKPVFEFELGLYYEYAFKKRDFIQFGAFCRLPTYNQEKFIDSKFIFAPFTADEVRGTIQHSKYSFGLELNYIFSTNKSEKQLEKCRLKQNGWKEF